jgi:hypothetical protein
MLPGRQIAHPIGDSENARPNCTAGGSPFGLDCMCVALSRALAKIFLTHTKQILFLTAPAVVVHKAPKI